ILLLSDGFPELSNENEELFGYSKLKNYFSEVSEKNPEEVIKHLKKKGFEWAGEKENDDDVTLVVIKVK
ncbi:MAG: SpoIIE family protein phosphatase, partial [Melioribacteraceae bacterium]|nr:SpoIIE family protein phosphatase [Melioribacteraceae bacterium]